MHPQTKLSRRERILTATEQARPSCQFEDWIPELSDLFDERLIEPTAFIELRTGT
jgi:hypothetical protein